MQRYINDIIHAFTYTYLENLSKKESNFNIESKFVSQQIENLPWYFNYAFKILLLFFNMYLIKSFKSFKSQDAQLRTESIKKVSALPFSFAKDFEKFFTNLSYFSYYSNRNDSEEDL